LFINCYFEKKIKFLNNYKYKKVNYIENLKMESKYLASLLQSQGVKDVNKLLKYGAIIGLDFI
jgi:hypothetical protein